MNSMPKLITEVFSGDEVRTVGRSFHPLHHQILEGASDVILEDFGPRLWRCEITTRCRISSQYLSALRLPPFMTNLVFPVREMPPPIQVLLNITFLRRFWMIRHLTTSTGGGVNRVNINSKKKKGIGREDLTNVSWWNPHTQFC